MQSGGAKGEKWRIDFDILQGGGRWENPLMGWASSYVFLHGLYSLQPVNFVVRADYMQGTRVSFRSKEDAIHFAEKQGMFICLIKYVSLTNCERLGLLRVSNGCFQNIRIITYERI